MFEPIMVIKVKGKRYYNDGDISHIAKETTCNNVTAYCGQVDRKFRAFYQLREPDHPLCVKCEERFIDEEKT